MASYCSHFLSACLPTELVINEEEAQRALAFYLLFAYLVFVTMGTEHCGPKSAEMKQVKNVDK